MVMVVVQEEGCTGGHSHEEALLLVAERVQAPGVDLQLVAHKSAT